MSVTDRLNGLLSSVAIKAPCKAATTANITLDGEQTIDGVSVVSGDRVLVWNQTDNTTNGIYVCDTGTWARDSDFNGNNQVVQGTIVLVMQGTLYGATIFQQTTASPVIGTTAITFAVLGAAALALASTYMRGTIFPLTTALALLSAISGMSTTAANTPSGNMTPSAGTWNLTGATVTVATAAAGDNDTSAASTAFVEATVGKVYVQTFTGSGTYTPHAGMKKCIIECVGGGGGGGGTASPAGNQSTGGGGGGAGSYAMKLATAADVGSSQTVTIGAAGSAGTAGNNAGGAGGDTSVGTLCIGKGGSGGAGSAGTTVTSAAGGAGGVAGTGDVTAPGQPGGTAGSANLGLVPSGAGGHSRFGGGGLSVASATAAAGNAGNGKGSGGSGGSAYSGGGTAAGGAGTAGFVVITEFCDQ